MGQFSIADFLPMLPNEGPPLPRFLGIYWPWAGQQSLGLPKLPALRQIVSDVKEVETNIVRYQAPLTTYENIEEVEFPNGFDPETLMPRKIVIHRKSKELK